MSSPLVLASSSPRRHELLRYLGIPFTVDPSGIDELLLPGLTPAQQAVRLAEDKARDVANRHSDAVVIGADTLVDLAGQILNKPHDREDALRMLRLLTGATHLVHSGIAVWHRGTIRSRLVSTAVRMRRADEAAIAAYVATGEPMDKAGAYAAQGEGAALIEDVEGSYLAVVGLPLLALRDLLQQAGITVPAPLSVLEALERGEQIAAR